MLCQDPKTTSQHLADIIATDYGLTLRLLTTVYSAFFSLERKDILSIRYIVVLLGMLNLKEVIIKAPILSTDQKNLLMIYLGSGLLVSFMAKQLASLSELDKEKAEVCGLLQNIGEVACAASVPKIVQKSLLPDSFVIKRKRFARMCGGYNPRRLGERLVRHWNLPNLIRIVITPVDFDLNSISEEERTIVSLIDTLNKLIKEVLSRNASKSALEDICCNLCDLLKIKRTVLDHQIFAATSVLETKCPLFYKHLQKIGLVDRLLSL